MLARCAGQEGQEGHQRLAVVAPLAIPTNFSVEEMRGHLEQQGYTRVTEDKEGQRLLVGIDRFRLANVPGARVLEALEAALHLGQGRLEVHADVDADTPPAVWRFSADLHCAECDIHYAEPSAAHFSFNSPIGACETCRGFGRVIGMDASLVIPDTTKTLAGGAVKPWQSPSFKEFQDDMLRMAALRGVPTDIA